MTWQDEEWDPENLQSVLTIIILSTLMQCLGEQHDTVQLEAVNEETRFTKKPGKIS